MIFWITIPNDAGLFLTHNLTMPLLLSGLPIVKLVMFYNRPNALKCTNIRRGADGGLEYYVKDYEWLVLRREDGSALNIWQVSQILQVKLDNGITISAGNTKTPDAFWTLAAKITAKTHASAIAPTMFALDVMKIQASIQQRRKTKKPIPRCSELVAMLPSPPSPPSPHSPPSPPSSPFFGAWGIVHVAPDTNRMLSFSFPGKLELSVYLTHYGSNGLEYVQFNGNNIEIVFKDAVVVSGVLYLLLNTPPSMGKRWAVITDRDGRPVPHHRIEVLQIWSEPLGLKVFKEENGAEILTALHKAMEERGVSLREFASQLDPLMFSMKTDEIVQKMMEHAPHLFTTRDTSLPPFCSNS